MFLYVSFIVVIFQENIELHLLRDYYKLHTPFPQLYVLTSTHLPRNLIALSNINILATLHFLGSYRDRL